MNVANDTAATRRPSLPSANRPCGHAHRQPVAVDDADFEGQRIETFDAAEIDAVPVPVVYAVADVHKDPAGLAEVVVQYLLIPEVDAQLARVVVRRKIGIGDIAGREHRTPS